MVIVIRLFVVLCNIEMLKNYYKKHRYTKLCGWAQSTCYKRRHHEKKLTFGVMQITLLCLTHGYEVSVFRYVVPLMCAVQVRGKSIYRCESAANAAMHPSVYHVDQGRFWMIT